ncbi:MAG: CDP-alcohol phosphatidyltransferase family protein [Phycisphaerales bacterium]|nr:CDP-alcohol phosphatidyltransferase family protein [Phycisphaerales bacterium]
MRLRQDMDDPATQFGGDDPSERGGRRRSRRIRLRKLGPTGVWPTLFTLGNLVAGFTAIHFAAKPVIAGEAVAGPWGWTSLTVASVLVLLGAFFDCIDGSVARLTDGVTEMGGQLDSLADLVTFGVAPAFITLHVASQYIGVEGISSIVNPDTATTLGKISWAIAAIFVCCAALRLARFNVETASGRLGDTLSFRGLPTPGAAGAVVGLVLMHEHLAVVAGNNPEGAMSIVVGLIAIALPFVALLAAIMMVSTVPYRHLANRYLRVSRSFGYLVRVAVLLCLAVLWLQETIAAVFLLYLCSGPVDVLLNRGRVGREQDVAA